VFGVGVLAAGSPIAAVAALATDNDNPAAPNIGMAFLRRFRFEAGFACDMERLSDTFGQSSTNRSNKTE
jgi:hypothetical protein